MTKQLEPVLALLDTHGIYIPQMYCNNIDQSIADEMHISMDDVRICQAGPDHERYWDAWSTIECEAHWIDDNKVEWTLYQNGDLWEVPEGFTFEYGDIF